MRTTIPDKPIDNFEEWKTNISVERVSILLDKGIVLKTDDIIKPFTINEKFLKQVLEGKWWKDNLPQDYKFFLKKEELYFRTHV